MGIYRVHETVYTDDKSRPRRRNETNKKCGLMG